MKTLLSTLSLLSLSLATQAGLEKASVTWEAEGGSVSAGKEIRTVITMTIDEGWHTYWENPGESGIPLSIKTHFPEGWKASEIRYPAPIRFVSGGLAGYGYEGVAHFPLTITPPDSYEGALPDLKAKLSWLTCDDSSCIPGSAEMTLTKSKEKDLFSEAYEALPKPWDGAVLTIQEEGEKVKLILELSDDGANDPTTFSLYPVNQEILDAGQSPRFSKVTENPGRWEVIWAKNEYFEKLPEHFQVVMTHGVESPRVISTK